MKSFLYLSLVGNVMAVALWVSLHRDPPNLDASSAPHGLAEVTVKVDPAKPGSAHVHRGDEAVSAASGGDVAMTPAEIEMLALGRKILREIQLALTLDSSVPYWQTRSLNESRLARDELADLLMQELEEIGAGRVDPGSIPIPYEKAVAALRIKQDYTLIRSQLYRDWRGIFIMPKDLEALQLLETEHHRDLDLLLSPEERFEFALRASSLADHFRFRLQGVDVTEAEFREAFKVRYDLEQLSIEAQQDPENAELQARLAEAEESEAGKLRDVFGEEHYDQFMRARSSQYRDLLRVAARLEVPSERADEAYDLITLYSEQRKALTIEDRSREESRNRWNEIEATLHSELTELLGESGVKAYSTLANGSWIRTLPTD